MGKIIVLDEVTANKIAAGEVVERPAAVVKELLENAIDAGALRIDISVTGGGRESIRVADNGSGMAPEDVLLSLQRHATSKIREVSDLDTILSLGFRGEALPSIASVSHLRLITRRPQDLSGVKVEVHGGKEPELTDVGCPAGTEVLVRDLFYNTPARLKFLKSEGAETARVVDTVQRLALAWPNISFSLSVNGREQLVTPGNGKLLDAIYQILGRQNGRQFVPLDWHGPLLSLQGYISRPSLSRANRNLQYFFVNNRPVRSPLLSDALQTAYQTLLPGNRFPAAVISIHTDPQGVDINIHPAKREIRFCNEREVYRQFLAGIRHALQSVSLVGEVSAPFTASARETAAAQQYAYYFPSLSPSADETGRDAVLEVGFPSLFSEKSTTFPHLRLIGQFQATYILAQTDSGDLYLIDQHAAHERVTYEMFKRDLEAEKMPVQQILPQTLELDPHASASLAASLKIFLNLGLTFEAFGNNTFILRTVPLFYRKCINQEDILDLVSCTDEGGKEDVLYEQVLRVMACKAAIKANQVLSREEMVNLLKNLSETKQPWTCPHGRPTTLVFTGTMVAKNFRRL
jgi:DNA mismatch repair protein MutL